MKKSSLAVPVSLTMALACLVSLNLSCRKKAEPADLPTALPPPTETNAARAPTPATNADVIAPAPAPEPASTNPPPVAAEPVTPPATPEPAAHRPHCARAGPHHRRNAYDRAGGTHQFLQ